MQTVKSYMKDSGDFMGKINLQNIPEGAVNLGYSGCSRFLFQYSTQGWFECP